MGSTTKNQAEMGFFDHLGELRKRIMASVGFILVFFIASWFVVEHIYHFFAVPILKLLPEGQNLAYTDVTAPFMMYIKLAFIAALFVSSPFVFHQLWLFIAPALFTVATMRFAFSMRPFLSSL